MHEKHGFLMVLCFNFPKISASGRVRVGGGVVIPPPLLLDFSGSRSAIVVSPLLLDHLEQGGGPMDMG